MLVVENTKVEVNTCKTEKLLFGNHKCKSSVIFENFKIRKLLKTINQKRKTERLQKESGMILLSTFDFADFERTLQFFIIGIENS